MASGSGDDFDNDQRGLWSHATVFPVAAVASIAGGDSSGGRAMAHCIAMRQRGAVCKGVVDLRAGIYGPNTVGVAGGFGAGIVTEVEDAVDPRGAIGITEIVVAPVKTAVEHGVKHIAAGNAVGAGCVVDTSLNSGEVSPANDGDTNSEHGDDTAHWPMISVADVGGAKSHAWTQESGSFDCFRPSKHACFLLAFRLPLLVR